MGLGFSCPVLGACNIHGAHGTRFIGGGDFLIDVILISWDRRDLRISGPAKHLFPDDMDHASKRFSEPQITIFASILGTPLKCRGNPNASDNIAWGQKPLTLSQRFVQAFLQLAVTSFLFLGGIWGFPKGSGTFWSRNDHRI